MAMDKITRMSQVTRHQVWTLAEAEISQTKLDLKPCKSPAVYLPAKSPDTGLAACAIGGVEYCLRRTHRRMVPQTQGWT